MSNILKSWQTSLTGLVIIGGLAYKAFTVGFSIDDAVFGLIAIGFIVGKDANKSHSIDAPTVDPEREYPDERG
ncbi:MAG: hypothetical protein GY793_06475 [Proteobacteria bacterium]|nr:hypothetical protein [Pseudomonadota bacterium]